MKYTLILVLLLPMTLLSQIQVGGEESKESEDKSSKEKTEKVKPIAKDTSHQTNVEAFIGATYASTFRVLQEKGGLFGDTISYQTAEVPLNLFSYEIGVRTQLNHFLEFEAGISYLQNGEQFDLTIEDSTLQYKFIYRYIGMPLKLNVTYGKTFKFHGGFGFIPQIPIHKYEYVKYRFSDSDQGEGDRKTTQNLNTFAISFIGNVGARYVAQNGWGIYTNLNYRMQLSSTYSKTYPFNHYGRAFGVSFGLLRQL